MGDIIGLHPITSQREVMERKEYFAEGCMDGCMTSDFTYFSTVFQSYQDNERMIMKGCMQWNLIWSRGDFVSSRARTWER